MIGLAGNLRTRESIKPRKREEITLRGGRRDNVRRARVKVRGGALMSSAIKRIYSVRARWRGGVVSGERAEPRAAPAETGESRRLLIMYGLIIIWTLSRH